MTLEVQGLGRQFAGRDGQPRPWVIRGLSFTLADGEFVTVIGPSGAGKSTILNLIAQVDGANEGRIVLDGETVFDATTPAPLRPGLGRRIGYVTQDDNLLPWRTLEENVLFGLEIDGPVDAASRERARALMATVGLQDYTDYYPHQLSGGMRKRAALIRTLVYDPPIILMDEPFGALDAETRQQLQSDLQALWALKRKTIIFVTHDIAEAIALGDRVLILDRAPAKLAAEHAVTLARPRIVDEILVQPEFVALYHRIRAQVR